MSPEDSIEIIYPVSSKICTKCKEEKSLNDYHFSNKQLGIYARKCKSCRSTQAKEIRARKKEEDPEKLKKTELDRSHRWAKNNPERSKELSRIRYAEWIKSDPEGYEKHLEEKRLKEKERREKDPETYNKKRIIPKKLWKKRNPEKCRAQWRKDNTKRHARVRNAEICDLTEDQRNEIFSFYKNRCYYCGKYSKKLTMDHVVPLSKNGNHTFNNIVPACQFCNTKKHNRAPLIPVQTLLVDISKSRRE